MKLSEADQAAQALVAAMFSRDCAAILAALGHETRLSYDGEPYEIGGVEAWLARFWLPGAVQIQPAKLDVRGSVRLLTAIGLVENADGAATELLRSDWAITVDESRVLAVDIGPITRTLVPQVVIAYIRATNHFNLNALIETFADDALVNDQLRDYWGKAAIREWAATEIVGGRITMAVVNIVVHYRTIIVTANVDGDFDKRGLPDPLVLAFYFSAHGDKIVQLIILRNNLGY
jgi:hypothetical protein